MGCGSSKATETVVNVATVPRVESTKKVNAVVEETPEQSIADGKEHGDNERLSSDKTKEDNSTEKPLQINQALHQHDWLAPLPEAEREAWLTTCSMCGTKDDVIVVPPMAMTSDSLMTYGVESAEGDITHVICKPTPYSDEETYASLDAHAVNADRSLNRDFTALMTYLLEPARTDLEKARVLFRWVTAQDLINMEFPDVLVAKTPERYLREIKENRESHVTLLAEMCRLAGLQHKIVEGHTKSVKFYPGSKLGASNFRGRWLQVLIDGRWGIVDTAWGSHDAIDDVDETAKDLVPHTMSDLDEFRFLPNPRHYLSTHLPDDDKHQFLSNPAAVADFEPHVKCRPHFFVHQLKLLSHHNGLVPTENGKAVIYIGFKPEDYSTIKFSSELQTMDRQSTLKNIKLDMFVQQDRKRDAVIFTIKPPEEGRFLFDILVGMEGDKSMKCACEYAIDSKLAMPEEDNLPLPEWQPGNNVLTKGIIPVSHPTTLVESSANDVEHNGDERQSSDKTKKDRSTEEPVQTKQAVHQHDWLAPVPEAEREAWLTTCSMCGTKDDAIITPSMTTTTDGLMTYDLHSAEGDVTHVVCKPKPYSDEDTYARLDAHAVKADRSLNCDFTSLMTYLLEPARTDLEKARVLFRWVTAQDLINMEFQGTPEEGTPEWYLQGIKMDKKSQDSLLAKMCSLTGLQHKKVRGYAKAVKCYPGTKLKSSDNGMWLLVLIDGRWGIIDSAWGAHHVIDDLDKTIRDLEQVYSFDEFYFLPNPRHFLSAHLPNDDRHQFLSTPASFADFEPHVKCGPYFFFHHLRLLSHHHGLVPTENGKAVIYIGFKPEDYATIKFSSRMQTMDRQSTWKNIKLDRFVLQDRKRDAVIFTIQPPEEGKFLFQIFSRTRFACGYAIDCEEAMPEEDNKPLPESHGTWGPGVDVMTKGIIPVSHPTPHVECPEGRAAIQFNLPEQMEFTTNLFETTTDEKHLKRYVAHEVVNGVATFNVINPSLGNSGLTIYAKGQEDEGKTFRPLCTYLASTDSPSEEVPFPSVANGRFGPDLPHFTDIGMSTRSHSSAFIECDDGELHIRMGTTKRPIITYTLTWETLEEKVNMDNYCYSEVRDGEVYFWLRLPKLGKYKLAIFAKEMGQEGGLPNVYNYCINCTGTGEDVKPFPPVNGGEWGQFSRCAKLGLTPTSHPTGFIEAEEDLEIVFDSTMSLDFIHDLKFRTAEGEVQDLDDFCCHKVLNEGKRTVVLVRFPHEGDFILQLYAKETEKGGQYGSVVNYLILCKKSAIGCTAFPKVWSRRWGPLYTKFSSMGLSLVSHTDPMIHSRTGALKISLGRSKPLQFLCRLYHCENGHQTELRNNVFIHDDLGDTGKMTTRVLMPHAGDYKLQISAKEAGDKKSYPTAINYLIHCSNAKHGSLDFPESFSNWGPGCHVHEPQMRALPAGRETHFKVTIPDAVDVAVISPDGKWSHLTKQEDGTWEGEAKIPEKRFAGKTVSLNAKINDGKNSFWTILEYVVGQNFSPVPIIWEGDEVGDMEDVPRTEEEPKPSTDRVQEDEEGNVEDKIKDEEEPASPADGELEDSNQTRHDEHPKSPSNGEDGSRDEQEAKSPIDGGVEGSGNNEQSHPRSNGEDKLRDEQETKSATDGEQNDTRVDEDPESSNKEREDESRNNEDSNHSNVGEQNDSRNEEVLKNRSDGERNESTDQEHQEEAEPSIDEDVKDEDETEPSPEGQGDVGNEDELHEPIDGQEEDYKIVLRQHQATIEEKMKPTMVIQRLEQEGFVDDEEAEELRLMVPENLPEVNKNILAVVTREGEDAFVVLREVMEETGQAQIVELIQHVDVEAPPDDSAERVKKKLRDAMKARNSKRLRNAIEEYTELGLSLKEPIYKEAKKRLGVLERLLQHRHAILKMESKTVSEIRGYKRPPAAVQQVMTATFLLLGNSKKETKEWKSLQALMGRTGKESLKRLVKKFQPNDVPPGKVHAAKAELKGLTKQDVHGVSSGAATFFVWVTEMIADVEERGKSE
ncbi:uncharacterized protein LOC144876434 [Branchiostoma floridae x Branchiostoma japonicum]